MEEEPEYLHLDKQLSIATNLFKRQMLPQGFKKCEEAINYASNILSQIEFLSFYKKAIKHIFFLAIDFLNQSQNEICFNMLCRIESLMENDNFSKVPSLITLLKNYFGCYFRRQGNLQLAITYFEEALELAMDSQEYLGLSHTNIGALFSQAGKFYFFT